jgi:hypothetical protein
VWLEANDKEWPPLLALKSARNARRFSQNQGGSFLDLLEKVSMNT